MRKTRVWITLGCCLFAVAIFAWAQATRKPGLYEVTSTMTWQQSPFPPGIPMPAGGNSPFGGGPHTMQICVTQAQIDKYDGPPPQTRPSCQMNNYQKTANGMTADMVCTGPMTGKGTVVVSYTEDGHGKTKVHMAGTMQGGRSPNPIPFEWTMESDSVFKGPDCGSVKPVTMPSDQ